MKYEEIVALDRATLIERTRAVQKLFDARLAASAKIKKAVTPEIGKVVAALQVAYTRSLNARDIAPDTTFVRFYESNVGGKPAPRLLALGRCFNRLVETGMLDEETYDRNTVDALELANAVFTIAEKEKPGTQDSPEIGAVINALKGLDADGKPLVGTTAAKVIRAIRDELKTKHVTPAEQVRQFLRTLPDSLGSQDAVERRQTLAVLDAVMSVVWNNYGQLMDEIVSARDGHTVTVSEPVAA